jgi:hypothetical protein
VKLLRLCLNFTTSVSDNSGTFKSLPLKIINLISVSSVFLLKLVHAVTMHVHVLELVPDNDLTV